MPSELATHAAEGPHALHRTFTDAHVADATGTVRRWRNTSRIIGSGRAAHRPPAGGCCADHDRGRRDRRAHGANPADRRAALDDPETGVRIVDLTDVTFLGSPGLAALLQATEQAQRRREPLRLVVDANRRPVIRPIAITGLDQLLTLCPTVDDALATRAACRQTLNPMHTTRAAPFLINSLPVQMCFEMYEPRFIAWPIQQAGTFSEGRCCSLSPAHGHRAGCTLTKVSRSQTSIRTLCGQWIWRRDGSAAAMGYPNCVTPSSDRLTCVLRSVGILLISSPVSRVVRWWH